MHFIWRLFAAAFELLLQSVPPICVGSEYPSPLQIVAAVCMGPMQVIMTCMGPIHTAAMVFPKLQIIEVHCLDHKS